MMEHIGILSNHTSSNTVENRIRHWKIWNKPVLDLDDSSFVRFENSYGSSIYWPNLNPLSKFLEKDNAVMQIMNDFKAESEKVMMKATDDINSAMNEVLNTVSEAQNVLQEFNNSNQLDYNFIRY